MADTEASVVAALGVGVGVEVGATIAVCSSDVPQCFHSDQPTPRQTDNYGGYSGSSGSGFRDSVDRRGFEEYNAGDDEVPAPRRSDTLSPASSSAAGASNRATSDSTTSRTAQKKQEKVVDLLGFDDDDFGGSSSAATTAPVPAPPVAEKALPAVASNPLDGEH